MRFETWEPVYLEILADFGFSRQRDDEAALFLSKLLGPRTGAESLGKLSGILEGRSVVVCGNAPCLASELEKLPQEDRKESSFIAADGATAVLMRAGTLPDVIVTDLDGDVDAILRSNRLGSVVVVHAHGDNLDALGRYVPRMKDPLGTTQSRPLENVHNFGGFTDGDRCVFLARSLGASDIRLIGFDYDDPTVTPRKAKKLLWAKRLIDLALSDGGP